MSTYIRKPEDKDDEQLLRDGWEFAGLSLFKHPQLSYLGSMAKQEALDQHMEYYCSVCGSCGEPECCTPDVCKCAFGESYKKSYNELLEENENLYNMYTDLLATYE